MALFSISTLLFAIAATLFPRFRYKEGLIIVGRWNLWIGAAFTLITLAAVLLMICANLLLFITAYKGGNLLYRYGLGVIPLPTNTKEKPCLEQNILIKINNHANGEEHAH